MKKYIAIFDQVSKVSLYLAIFLIPLFFLPFAQNVLSHPKQILLLFLLFLSGICWLIKQQIEGKVVLKESKLFYFILIFLFFSVLLSSVFSIWPTASFWGIPLSITDSFLTFFCFLLLAFLFVNIFQNEKEVFFAVFLLLISGAIAAVFLILQLYGVFVLPFDFSQVLSFNTIGSVYQAALFLAALLPISLVLAFQVKKPVFWLIFLVLLSSIILIDFSGAWIVLLLGTLVLSIFGLTSAQGKVRAGLAASLMVLLVLSIFFFFFPLRVAWFPALPFQISPGVVTEMEVLRGVYSEGPKNFLLGSGPGTFILDYSKHRSPLLNETFFWGTRFSSGNSEFLDWFITKGFLPGISLILFIVLLIYVNLRKISKKDNPFKIRLGFLASAVALVGASFYLPFSFSMWFLFWIVLAGLLFYNLKTKQIDLTLQSRRITFSVLILAVIVLGATLFFFQGQKYLAEVNYLKGIRLSQENEFVQAMGSIQRATAFNPSVDAYWRDLAQLSLVRANLIVQDDALEDEQKNRLIQEIIANGVYYLNQAVNVSPSNVANWNVRGFFFRNLIFIPGAGERAIESYLKASELEPASPFPYGEIGRVYILMADIFKREEMLDQKREALLLAIENLQKSIELKSDYAPGHYLLAVAYDQQGKKDDAIARLEEIKRTAPENIGILFQLGMLHWRKEDMEKAQDEFERVISLNPDYSNARYMLGLVYDKKEEKEKAISEFEKVAQLNPDNQEVQQIIRNLKDGLPALDGIVTLDDLPELPIEEIPPEIQE